MVGIDTDHGKIFDQLDFTELLFLQINRVNESMSKGKEEFANALQCLLAMVNPYEDTQFKNNVRKLMVKVNNNIRNESIKKGYISLMTKMTYTMLMSHELYAEIMKLLDRRGFLAEEEYEELIGK